MSILNLKIEAIEHSLVYKHFGSKMRKEQVAIKKFDDKTKYLGAFVDDYLVGCVGWQEISKDHIRYKTDYVVNNFRGRKIYTNLWKSRDLINFKEKISVISAYCTPLSISMYMKYDFKIQSVKGNIKYLKKII
jgi:hypothetical protein|tara:strand:- start:83 stop:481 length:399 start_codon:yes stop_codon:yes gene_type:complete